VIQTVIIDIGANRIELTLSEAAQLRAVLDDALDWSPGWSPMIFHPIEPCSKEIDIGIAE
jgi:hypothetical protein